MGAFLERPKIDKFNESGDGKDAGERYKYAVASMQGWRVDMEDAHGISVSLMDIPPLNKWSFFAVFDGHAGSNAAKHSSENLLKTLLETNEFKQLVKEMKNKDGKITDKAKELIKEGLKKGFMVLDESMQTLRGESEREKSGTTAVCAILTPEYIFFANLGDSRGVLSRKNMEVFSTEDHKPYITKERERIIKAGGSVMIQRVNGCLAVSRALGDFEYKSVPNLPRNEQLVSPEPDVYVIARNHSEDEFLVLACDGIFDVLTNEELCNLVRSRLLVTSNLEQAANQVLDVCLSKGSRDNMTMILIVFDSAPKPDPRAAQADKEWAEKMEHMINGLIDTADKTADLDAESMTTWLKDREGELQPVLPGGIHLARPLIHRILEERGGELFSANSSEQEERITTGGGAAVVGNVEKTPQPSTLLPTDCNMVGQPADSLVLSKSGGGTAVSAENSGDGANDDGQAKTVQAKISSCSPSS